MVNIPDVIRGESQEYDDEKIKSNVYFVSERYSMRALKGMPEKQREALKKDNFWLLNYSEKCVTTITLNFDKIKELVDVGRKSCDAFFYDFYGSGKSYLAEIKSCSSKRVLLDYIKDFAGEKSIYEKIKSSADLIKNDLVFGGRYEHDELIRNTHVFLVYDGKNNVAGPSIVGMLPRKERVSRDVHNKQNKASRMRRDMYTEKQEKEILTQFGDRVCELGFCSCKKNEFPGDAIPKAEKVGGEKVRKISIFSAKDFADVLESDFFEALKLEEYPGIDGNSEKDTLLQGEEAPGCDESKVQMEEKGI